MEGAILEQPSLPPSGLNLPPRVSADQINQREEEREGGSGALVCSFRSQSVGVGVGFGWGALKTHTHARRRQSREMSNLRKCNVAAETSGVARSSNKLRLQLETLRC